MFWAFRNGTALRIKPRTGKHQEISWLHQNVYGVTSVWSSVCFQIFLQSGLSTASNFVKSTTDMEAEASSRQQQNKCVREGCQVVFASGVSTVSKQLPGLWTSENCTCSHSLEICASWLYSNWYYSPFYCRNEFTNYSGMLSEMASGILIQLDCSTPK